MASKQFWNNLIQEVSQMSDQEFLETLEKLDQTPNIPITVPTLNPQQFKTEITHELDQVVFILNDQKQYDLENEDDVATVYSNLCDGIRFLRGTTHLLYCKWKLLNSCNE